MGFASINDQRLTAVQLRVPARGAWTAECDFESDPAVSGRVTLLLGSMVLSGTIVDAQAGVFGAQRKLRLVGGAAGWGKKLPVRGYHNDAGIKAKLVAEDLARETGELLGQFLPAAERLGVDYARDANSAAAGVLEDVIGGVPWWVDAGGLTQVGQRPTRQPLPESEYQIQAFDPRERVAMLTVTDPSMLSIGTVLSSPALPEPLQVHEYQVQADAQSVRIVAWCSPQGRTAGRLAGLWQAVTARAMGTPLLGLYLYRVVSMSDGRVSVQAVHREAGLPNLGPISQWPGVAGIHAELTPGAEVLVGFIGGDRDRPVLTHYAGRGGEGFKPVSIVIGGTPAAPAARQGDAVEVLLPPGVFTGTVGGAPATGVISFPPMKALGIITAGSSKVSIAS
jgi:hypothetical protein